MDKISEFLAAGPLWSEFPPWLGVPLLSAGVVGGAYMLYQRLKM